MVFNYAQWILTVTSTRPKGGWLLQGECLDKLKTHPLGSMDGRYWMRKGATFSKLKITHHVRRGSSRNVSDFCFIIYNIRFYLFDNYTDEELS